MVKILKNKVMSKLIKISLLLLVVVSTISCNNSDDEDLNQSAPQVRLRAQVGGASFRTDNASGILSNNGSTLVITGINEMGESLMLRIGNFTNASPMIVEGTYDIDGSGLAAMSFTSGELTFNDSGENGGFITISIFDEDQNTVFGTFAGTVENSQSGEIEIMAGMLFNVPFTVE